MLEEIGMDELSSSNHQKRVSSTLAPCPESLDSEEGYVAWIFHVGTICDPITISTYLALMKMLLLKGEDMLGPHLNSLPNEIGCHLTYSGQ
jgi:hypothetical protein